jgi:hypothetical protein
LKSKTAFNILPFIMAAEHPGFSDQPVTSVIGRDLYSAMQLLAGEFGVVLQELASEGEEYMSSQGHRGVVGEGDIYVAIHKSEGQSLTEFNLRAAEMAAASKQ